MTALLIPFPRAPAPFEQLDEHGYDLMMVDPPWPTKRRSPKGDGKSFTQHYGDMTWEEIIALPVGKLASRNTMLCLWVPAGITVHGGDPKKHYAGADAALSLPGRAVNAWGFRFSTEIYWLKTSKNGKPVIGTGYRARNGSEKFWVCIRGAPKAQFARDWFFGVRREHSAKPEEAYAVCERAMPHARKLELFSRRTRPGWTTWGYEAGKFDPVVNIAVAA